MAILSKSGGTPGAVFGTFFIAAAKPLVRTDLTVAAPWDALASGMQAVRDRVKAQPGDEAMIGAVLPAVEAAGAAARSDLDRCRSGGSRRRAEATRADRHFRDESPP